MTSPRALPPHPLARIQTRPPDPTMEFGRQQRGPEVSPLPSIFIATDPLPRFRHAPHSMTSSSPISTTTAMTIPGVQRVEEVPPPLPPPQFPFGKPPNSDYREQPSRRDSFASFGSREPSLFGCSFGNSMDDHRGGAPIVRVERDEGYASLSSTRYETSPVRPGVVHRERAIGLV